MFLLLLKQFISLAKLLKLTSTKLLKLSLAKLLRKWNGICLFFKPKWDFTLDGVLTKIWS